MTRSEKLSHSLVLLMLFFIAAGPMTIPWIGLKIGGKAENLLPLLLTACLIHPASFRFNSGLKGLLSPIYLILAGLLSSWAFNQPVNGFEDLVRLLSQWIVGALLAAWFFRNSFANDRGTWIWVWILGMLALQWNTPWLELSNPKLEGSFGHRNIQTAFYLLSFPILAAIYVRKSHHPLYGWIGTGLILLEVLFVVLSKSRSGFVGIFIALAFSGCLGYGYASLKRVISTRMLLMGGALLAIALIFLLPRFWLLGIEITNPYRLSRLGIWSAAIQGLRELAQWLLGAGMGDGYFWAIQSSDMGNLNHLYRRGHHPHCLYLQWIYWGGMLALIGWMQILRVIWRTSMKPSQSWLHLATGACLIGYCALELFETAMLNPRIAILFSFNLCLMLLSAHEQIQESVSDS